MAKFQIDPENKEQQLAYDIIANTNSSFFLTGRAGTGKTSFLHNVQKMVDKQFIVLAPTGIAAILAGGETMHAFFGLPLEACPLGTRGKMSRKHILALIHADTIIIDEVSMARCDVIDAMDYTMRHVLRNNMPFGGKQMIFVGDMFQLPPVVKEGPEKDMLKDIYKTEQLFFYKSFAVNQIRLTKIEFRKVYRQEDENFLKILEDIRMNRITGTDMALLNQRVGEPTEQDGMVITLTSVNKTADKINLEKLNEINSKEFTYNGVVEGEFDEKKFPVNKDIRLKVGAQIIFTRNDLQKRWANGTIGKISKLTEEEIQVTLDTGNTYIVPQMTWEAFAYEYDEKEKKLKKERTGAFTQYPLKLAWAITIHKSQGMTFEKMSLNLNHGMFAPGQLYVALSRVRSLKGLFLSKEICTHHANTSQEIISYASGYNNTAMINNEIESGKAVYNALKQNDYDEAAKQYLSLVLRKADQGDRREALQQAKRFLDTLICDEGMYGYIENIPEHLLEKTHYSDKFIAALLCLYARKYDLALKYIEDFCAYKTCNEALYIKARALEKLGQYKEADDIFVIIFDKFDKNTPDIKMMYAAAMLNERHTKDPGLPILQMIVDLKPAYLRTICDIRVLAKEKDIKLITQENNEIIKIFNSDITNEEFSKKLREAHHLSENNIEILRKCIRQQDFQNKNKQD